MKSTMIKHGKRTLSLLLIMALCFGIIPMLSPPVKAEPAKTGITSLTYNFVAAGVTSATEVTFEIQGASWETFQAKKNITANGAVSFEFPAVTAGDGLRNPGFTPVIAGCPITLELKGIIINGTQTLLPNTDLELDLTLQVGVEGPNGLPNQWNTALKKGDFLAKTADGNATLKFNEYWEYFAPGTGGSQSGTKTNISSLTYNFNAAGITNATELTFEILGANWETLTVKKNVSANGAFTFEFPTASMGDGLRNPGFVALIAGSPITVELKSVVVNGTHTLIPNKELGLDFTLQVGVEGPNGLPNQWHASLKADDIFASAADGSAFLKFNTYWEFFLGGAASGPVMKTKRSVDYVKAMGNGWNLGNTFDGFDVNGGTGIEKWETAWGNPVTTKAFIKSIKTRGYDHIRIPFSIIDRGTDKGASTPASQIRYEIDKQWLNRYKEVVQWAVDEGLYVMINIHHDSWYWMGRNSKDDFTNPMGSAWDGKEDSAHFRRFCDYWKQIADAFKDMPDKVMFETLNEPEFNSDAENQPVTVESQRRLEVINKAAYDIIRAIPANKDRMIVIPTWRTNHAASNSNPTVKFIAGLNDENIIATVHYYSEWVFSQHLGRMLFDEPLFNQYDPANKFTARDSADNFFDTLDTCFISKGIGVSVGEWGLLGYDADADDGGNNALQRGEELKYYEYMLHKARRLNGVSLTFWDNGSGIDRKSTNYSWRVARVGEMLLTKERSSYSKGLDTAYFTKNASADLQIPLELNGNTFTSIAGLTQGTDYTYANGVITLKQAYINKKIADKTLASGSFNGIFDTLVIKFSGGADWNYFLVFSSTAASAKATGTRAEGITIPVGFRGNHVHRVSAFKEKAPATLTGLIGDATQGTRVGGRHTSWFPYLEYGSTYTVDYKNNTLTLRPGFFTESVVNGDNIVVIEFLDGSRFDITLDVNGKNITAEAGGSPPYVPVVVPNVKKGDVNGNGGIDIGDALEILKYLAKMSSLIDKGGDALEASLILPASITAGKPAIGDALEILKNLAKMTSLVY